MKKRLLLLLLPLLLAAASTQPPEKRAGKDYAVFFYVTKFQPGWQGLPDTKTEAEDLKSTLETQYGFEGKLVPNPTRQQIFDEIAAWNNRLGPDDQVLFFFSMHGYYDPESELGYLIAADGLYRDEYFKTWLDYNSLRPYFARCKAKHMLVALDACYSGSFGNIEKAPDHPAYDETQDCQTQIDATFNFRVRQYICAGNKDSKTPGKSLFAAKMLETLRQSSNSDTDGILHFDDLTYALGKVRNPEPVHGTFTGHAPGGEFVFVRKNACAQGAVIDLAEEQTWKIAQNRKEGRIYLDEYPNGRYAQAAMEMEAEKGKVPPKVITPEEKPLIPVEYTPYSIECRFTCESEFDPYVPKIRPLAYSIKDEKLKERVLNNDFDYFEKQLNRPLLLADKKEEYRFYLGYTLFVSKRFSQASQYFNSYWENTKSEYYAPSEYYYACIKFYEGKFDESRKRFQRIENNAVYKEAVSIHILNTWYANKKQEKVIEYGTALIKGGVNKNISEIKGIVGLAYFDMKNYRDALPYLEAAVVDGFGSNDDDILLKLAKTQMELGYFKPAIENFETVSKSNEIKTAQQAKYFLARSYLAIGNKSAARNMLDNVRSMQVDKEIQEEATLNFGKLSYELKLNFEAISALSSLIYHGKYGPEAGYWIDQAQNN